MSTTDTPTAAPPRELFRTRNDRIVAGVAGGLGRYFDLSPTFFRVAFVILALVGGAGFLIYVAAALVIPAEGEGDSIVSEALKRHRDRPWLLLGVALVGIALVSIVVNAHFWPNSDFAWFLLLVGVLAIVVAQRRDPSPRPAAPAPDGETAPASPSRPSLFLPGVGMLLAAAGALAVVAAAGVDVPWSIVLGVAAVGVGVAVAVGALLQRRTGGLLVVGILLAATALAVSAVDVRLEGEVGDRVYRPLLAGDVSRTYDLAVGDFEIDLSQAMLAPGETRVDAELGIGELTIVVPADVAVDVDATISAGDMNVLGRQDDGFDDEIAVTESGSDATRTLVLDAHVGFGSLVIERADD